MKTLQLTLTLIIMALVTSLSPGRAAEPAVASRLNQSADLKIVCDIAMSITKRLDTDPAYCRAFNDAASKRDLVALNKVAGVPPGSITACIEDGKRKKWWRIIIKVKAFGVEGEINAEGGSGGP